MDEGLLKVDPPMNLLCFPEFHFSNQPMMERINFCGKHWEMMKLGIWKSIVTLFGGVEKIKAIVLSIHRCQLKAKSSTKLFTPNLLHKQQHWLEDVGWRAIDTQRRQHPTDRVEHH